ncbi:class I SAM-dependent methyltransferase [bacterium]|nr:class I SAM-dependent methyltransferase [bacterium]
MNGLWNVLLGRSGHECPWWCCFTFDNFLRRHFQDPSRILSGHVAEGATVLDIGPGQGYFSIPMARMAGTRGRVIAADIQRPMLSRLQAKARAAGVADRIEARLLTGAETDLGAPLDFALAFWMAHEVADTPAFFALIARSLKPGKCLLIAEPFGHVSKAAFERTVAAAAAAGFTVAGRPAIAFSRSVLLRR